MYICILSVLNKYTFFYADMVYLQNVNQQKILQFTPAVQTYKKYIRKSDGLLM